MGLENLKSVFGNIQKFTNTDITKLESNLDIDGPATQINRTPQSDRDRVISREDALPLTNFIGDTSDLNIDGTPIFDTTPLSEIYLKFSSNTQGNIEPETTSVGGGFSLNFNSLFKAATGEAQNLNDIFSLGNTKIMTTSEFANASLYYIDSNFGDVLAVDATINKFGKLGDNFNQLADKHGLPGLKIPNISLSGQIENLNPFADQELIYQNQVYELFNTDVPNDTNAPELASDGSFFGVPQFQNPYRGIAFQVLGEKNKAGGQDYSYQGQVVNLSTLEIKNPIAAWRSGDIQFKQVQLPKMEFSGKFPGISGFNLDLPKIDFPDLPPLPKIDIPNLKLPDFDFPKLGSLSMPKLKIPKFDYKFDFSNFNTPNIDLSAISLPNLPIGTILSAANSYIKSIFDSINPPNLDLPNINFPKISGFGFPIKFPKIPLPEIKLPDIDFSKIGGALQDTAEFLNGVTDKVGGALSKASDAIGSAVAPAKDFISKIKVSPFRMNGQIDWGNLGIDVQAGNLNPIKDIRLPALKLQNPLNVNKTDFGGVGLLVGNNPRSDKLLDTVSRKRVAPNGVVTETYAENATVGVPYSQLGKIKYTDNMSRYYPEMLNQDTGDPHTTAKMIPNLKHLNSGYAINGSTTNSVEAETYGMPFYFYDLRDNTYIIFRAYIEALTEQLSPSWSSQNYVGRSEPVYIYERTERSIDFTLKLHAGSAVELDSLYSKMRRLTSLCYPEYKADTIMSVQDIVPAAPGAQGGKLRMKPPLTRLRIGELFGRSTTIEESQNMPSKNDVLGYIKSLSYSVPDTSPWEYRHGQRVPKHLLATISYQVIHDQPPHKGTDFYGYAGSNVV